MSVFKYRTSGAGTRPACFVPAAGAHIEFLSGKTKGTEKRYVYLVSARPSSEHIGGEATSTFESYFAGHSQKRNNWQLTTDYWLLTTDCSVPDVLQQPLHFGLFVRGERQQRQTRDAAEAAVVIHGILHAGDA